jgi:hypothetical protein
VELLVFIGSLSVNSTSINLISGGHFDYAIPESSVYDVKDIALSLSHTARFSGQTDRPYYVAQHSVLVSKIVPPEHALAGLFHDGTEAFLCDVPKPLKNLLPDYVLLEKRAEADLCKRFGIKFPLHPCVKEADNIAFVTERRDMQPGVPLNERYAGIEPLPTHIIAWDSRTCYLNFLRRFEELTK